MKIEFKDNVPHITPETNQEEDILFGWYEKYKGKRMDCCMSLNWVERAGAEPTKREQANENIPLVNNRTFIVTIECGEDTTDWRITAPNELAAKITASANYNRKRFNILRCVEYGY